MKSEGREENPVPAGKWIKVPEGDDQALCLDKNTGTERFYLVATRERWHELEDSLGKASHGKTENMPVASGFLPETRGASGTRQVNIKMPPDTGKSFENPQQVIKEKADALVIKRWLNHVNPPQTAK